MNRFLLILLFCFTSFSQIKQSYIIGGNLVGGNSTQYQLNTESTISNDSSTWSWTINPNFIYSEYDNDGNMEVKQREFFTTGNISRRYGKWKLISNVDAENSYQKQIKIRGAFGIGIGYDIIRKEFLKFSVSELVMPETYISNTIGRDLSSIRSSTRIKIEYEGKLNLSSITFIQPAIWNNPPLNFMDNINIRSTTKLSLPINKKLSLGVGMIVNGSTYSTFINHNIKPIDWTSFIQLQIKNF